LTHSFGGFAALAVPNFFLDPGANLGIDVLPVLEGAAQDRLAHAAEQASSDLIDQLAPLLFVEDLTHEDSGLAEVIIILAQRVGTAHHFTISLPAIINGASFIRPGTTAAVGGI